MLLQNAIAIGKDLGKFLKADHLDSSGFIYCSYLRILVEIDVRKPLKPGFSLGREDGPPMWISFKYK